MKVTIIYDIDPGAVKSQDVFDPSGPEFLIHTPVELFVARMVFKSLLQVLCKVDPEIK